MMGHDGKVTNLLYPHANWSVFDAKYLISGRVDFNVRMWDIYTGSLVHTFSAHSGAVTNIVVCPENMSVSPWLCLSVGMFIVWVMKQNMCVCAAVHLWQCKYVCVNVSWYMDILTVPLLLYHTAKTTDLYMQCSWWSLSSHFVYFREEVSVTGC